MSAQVETIYNNHVANEKLKLGTKYEKLTAMIFKLLEANSVVIHDLRLRSDGKTASHQIDVTVEGKDIRKRILVECKDYDENKVGIALVRNFFGAVSQIKPDESYIVTTVGFTKPAIQFAEDENIKLLLLQPVTGEELENRIEQINLTLVSLRSSYALNGVIADDENEKQKLRDYPNKQGQSGDMPIRNSSGVQTTTLFTEIKKIAKTQWPKLTKELIAKIKADPGYVYNVTGDLVVKPNHIDFNGIKLDGVVVSHDIRFDVIENTIVSDGILVLILKSLDGTINKFIRDIDISKYTFNEDGEVINKA